MGFRNVYVMGGVNYAIKSLWGWHRIRDRCK
jgi:hypothetical protein